jgi:hypothetical protein
MVLVPPNGGMRGERHKKVEIHITLSTDESRDGKSQREEKSRREKSRREKIREEKESEERRCRCAKR